jgi:hypothetical protein
LPSPVPASDPAHVKLRGKITLTLLNVEAGASLTGGKATLSRSLGWTGGTLATKLIMSAGSVGNIDGPETKQLGGVFNSRGSVSLRPDAALLLPSKTKVNNFGTFTAQHGARIQGKVCSDKPATINNTGTFSVTPP